MLTQLKELRHIAMLSVNKKFAAASFNIGSILSMKFVGAGELRAPRKF